MNTRISSRIITFQPRSGRVQITALSPFSNSQKMYFRNTSPKKDEASLQTISADFTAQTPPWFLYYKNKFEVTAEISVSKLFPAGFGWQGFSVLAVNNGMGSTSLGFFGMTGVGDALGVGSGHLIFNAIKAVLGWKVDFAKEMQTSLFLSTATIFSGFCW